MQINKDFIVHKDKTPNNYLEEFLLGFKVLDNNSNSERFSNINYSIYDKTLKYLKAAKQALEDVILTEEKS
ncbi:MAG: hypothetical protein AB8U25_05280 [Rickettsiales endosymbiont of Dermacentor nuttalli]